MAPRLIAVFKLEIIAKSVDDNDDKGQILIITIKIHMLNNDEEKEDIVMMINRK